MSELTEGSYFPLTETISLHYRIWGSIAGVPVLFVHGKRHIELKYMLINAAGGPGNDIAHYRDINTKFFEPDRYMVIEVDQRGTGKSQPSVQDDYQNMQHYLDISISQMSNDFERLRVHLNVDKWLVFGR
jgi:pimeloyl-ACP methyl ester carboxylesterase